MSGGEKENRMMTNIREGGDALEKNILVTDVAISITTMGNGEVADTGWLLK